MIRVGVVGCGAVVRAYHMPAIRSVRALSVAVLCDLKRQNAERLQKMYRVEAAVTDRLEDLKGRVDAALVAVNPGHHASVAMQLLDMGIDVFCEKPLASSSAEGEQMIAAAARNNSLLAVGQWCRFLPNFPLLRTLVLDGAIGEVQEITSEFGGPLDWPMDSPAYFSRQSTAGGVLFEAGIHMVDAVVWLFGDVSGIQYADDSFGGVEANAELRGTVSLNGRDVPLRCSFSWTDPKRNGIHVRGTTGSAMASPAAPETVVLRQTTAAEQLEIHVHRARWHADYGTRELFRDQMRDFAAAVAERREPHVTATSAIAGLRIVERAYAVRQQLPQPWLAPSLAK